MAPDSTDPTELELTSTTLAGWQIGVIVLVAVCCLLAAAAVTIWCVAHKKKDTTKRHEFNSRMAQFYDSISIDENLSGLNYDMFSHESEGGSTVSTQISTPTTPRTSGPSPVLQSYKISNGKLPFLHFHHTDYKFSLEDTAKKLQELDSDNIAQIKNSYRYFGSVDDMSLDGDLKSVDIHSPTFRHSYNVNKAFTMDSVRSTQKTHL